MKDARTEWKIFDEIWAERERQDERWGEQNHPVHRPNSAYTPEYYTWAAEVWKHRNTLRVRRNGTVLPDRNCYWDGILLEEIYEALAETDPEKIRTELVQVAAVAVAMIKCLDRAKRNRPQS